MNGSTALVLAHGFVLVDTDHIGNKAHGTQRYAKPVDASDFGGSPRDLVVQGASLGFGVEGHHGL